MIIQKYFSMGRHVMADLFYLCQSYSRIPKQLLRDNANLLILFRMDDLNLKHAYSDHVNTDMDFEKFKERCGLCWREPHGFIVIAKEFPLQKGRYRRGFDHFITIRQ